MRLLQDKWDPSRTRSSRICLAQQCLNIGSPHCMQFLGHILLDIILPCLYLHGCGGIWWDLWYDLGEEIFIVEGDGYLMCPFFLTECYIDFQTALG